MSAYLTGQDRGVSALEAKTKIRKLSKKYITWKGNILRWVSRDLRPISPIGKDPKTFRSSHNGVGHWEVQATKTF